MQYKGSTTIKRRPKDGIPGKDAHSPYIGVNGNWYFWDDATDKFKDSGLSAQGDDGHSPYINTSTNTWYEWNVETGAYKDTGIKAIGVDGEPGGPGSDGLPGQIPFQKEWKQGDTHRYNDNIIDYIYVRGANKDQSYWYKRVAKGDVTAGVPPTGGVTPTGYERIDWLNNLAINVLIAEEANIANFIFKDGVFWSLKGTVDGVEADYTGQTNFIPNVVIDGKTGKITANSADISGKFNVKNANGDIIFKVDSDTLISKTSAVNTIRTVKSTNFNEVIPGVFGGSSLSNIIVSPTDIDVTNYKYELSIPTINITGNFNYSEGEDSECVISVYLRNSSDIIVGTISETAIKIKRSNFDGLPLNDSYPINLSISSKTVDINVSDTYRISVGYRTIGMSSNISDIQTSISGAMNLVELLTLSHIGKDGMLISNSTNSYTYMSNNEFEAKRDSFGLRVTNKGIQYTTNGTEWKSLV
ncbi:MAG: hypothetical protein WCR45_11370 [Bacteroidaceae bacterium]